MFSVIKKEIIFLKRSKVMDKDIRKIKKRTYLRGICTIAVVMMISGCGVSEKNDTKKDEITLKKYNIVEDEINIEDRLDNESNEEAIEKENIILEDDLVESKIKKNEIKKIYIDMDIKERTVLKVELSNEKILEKEYEGTWAVTTYQADLLNRQENAIVLILTNEASNYGSSEVHVLQIVEDKLVEILTIQDDVDIATVSDSNYRNSLFLIPWPKDNFKLKEAYKKEYATVCSGASIVEVDKQGKKYIGLKIEHGNGSPQLNTYYELYGKEGYPYSILLWNGERWTVDSQGVEFR